MRLYHHPLSSNARRAVMTAIQLASDVELVRVSLETGEQRQPGFLKLNPNGRVPVLDDDGFTLTESHAIMQYLADKAGNASLYPTGLRQRADVNRWLFWSAHHFTPAVSVLNWEHMVKKLMGQTEPDPKEVARGEKLVTDLGAILNGHLEDRRYLAQDTLTLADLAVVTPLMSMKSAKLPLDNYRHIHAWFERMQELDAWKKTNP